MPRTFADATTSLCAQPGFEVMVRARGRRHVTLALRGEFDLAAATLFAAVVTHHCRAGRRFVDIDMSGVTLLDSTALRAIVAAHNELLANHGQLTLRSISPRVARLLQITGLDSALHIRHTHGDAHDRTLAAIPPLT